MPTSQLRNDHDLTIGLILLSEDWRIIGMNEQARQLVDPARQTLGKDLFQLHAPAARGKVRGILRELSAPGEGMANTMILDFLGKVLMLNLSRMTVMAPGSQATWAVTFMDVSAATGALPNRQGHLELKKLPIYENGVFHFLSVGQVYAIEADGNYCRIHTPGRVFYLLMSLKAVLQRFATADFFRVHKSFIVNLGHLTAIDTTSRNQPTIAFDDPTIPAVPVSRRLLAALKMAISQRYQAERPGNP